MWKRLYATLHTTPLSLFRIQPATRNEPSAEVSQFNVASGSGSKKRKLREEDLIRSIKKKKPKVAKKLESVKKIKTLPKPLETFHEKKVENVCGSKWFSNEYAVFKSVFFSSSLCRFNEKLVLRMLPSS